jgi:superfamily II DNA helicase RecQ
VLPTAGGKGDIILISALVQLRYIRDLRKNKKVPDGPPLVVLVHLPTTALLEDMHARFTTVETMLNFTCCYLGSTQLDLSVSAKAVRGDYQIVLATTERFSTFIPNHAGFINPTITIAAEYFDETHVILDVDDHFRPRFLTINDIPRRDDGFRVLRGAFAATVEADNLELILAYLSLQNAKIIKVDPARHNMNLECSPKAIGDESKEADCAKMYEVAARHEFGIHDHVSSRMRT